jgi:hypothetical protein
MVRTHRKVDGLALNKLRDSLLRALRRDIHKILKELSSSKLSRIVLP